MPAPTWNPVFSLPSARWGMGAATGTDGTIYAIGGFTGSGFTNEVDAYNPTTHNWSRIANLPDARYSLAAVSGLDGTIYAIGGYGPTNFSSEVDAYSPVTHSWSVIASLPSAREGLAAARGSDGTIYVMGGEYSNSGAVTNEADAYNPTTRTWSTIANFAGTGRTGLAAAAGPDGTIYAIGGQDTSGTVQREVDAYNPATGAWTTAASLPTGGARSYLAATTGSDGTIYAVGGFSGGTGSEVDAYNATSHTWTTLASLSNQRSQLAAAAGTDGIIYAIGGQTQLSTALSEVDALSPPPVPGTNQFNDMRFQLPYLGGGYAYDAKTLAPAFWTFSGSAGLTGNGNAFTSGNPNTPLGPQAAFLQMTGSISQTVNFTVTGTYIVAFNAAQRGNNQASSQTFQVQVDGQVVGTFTPGSTNYANFATNSFAITTAGNHTVSFVGLDPQGGDNTAFIDQAIILPYTPPAANQVGDPGFELVSVGTGSLSSYAYNPVGPAWVFGGSSGLAGNGSTFTAGNPNAPQGTQVAFLQMTGSISQAVNFTTGLRTISFSAAQRGTSQAGQTFQVQVDGQSVFTCTPVGPNYTTYTTNSFNITTAGSHTVAFVGLNPQGGDNTALIDQVSIQFYNPPPANQVNDSGFEMLNVGSGLSSYAYNPTGSPWTFSASSGVAGNASVFTAANGNAPQGNQVAFLQGTGTISQTLSFTTGNYTFSFLAAQRTNPLQSQTFQLQLDGAVLGTFTPPDAFYTGYTTAPVAISSGTHTVSFVGLNPRGGDNTALLDAVSIATAATVNYALNQPTDLLVASEVPGLSQYHLQQYTQAGTLVSSQLVSLAPASTDFAEARGLTVDPAGNVNIFDGDRSPSLAMYSPSANTWTYRPYPAWSAGGTVYSGSLAAYNNFVFASDVGTQGGIVRFDSAGSPTVRFAQGQAFSQVTLGRDGLLYAVPVSSLTVYVYNPATFALVRTVFLNNAPDVPISLAVDANGQIFAAGWGGSVAKYDAHGNFVTKIQENNRFGSGENLLSIALDRNGQIAVGGEDGQIYLTDESLVQASVQTIQTNQSEIFVTFDHYIGVNHAPVANSDTYAVNENSTLTVSAAAGVLANDTDADSDTLHATVVAAPAHGQLTLNADGSFSYTPTANFSGADSFTYQANDGALSSNTANVTIFTGPPNQLSDPGFEVPFVGTGSSSSFAYNPVGSPWTFTSTAGVAGNGSSFTASNPNAPQGTQVAFLENTGSISQVVNFSAGNYSISLSAAQRANNQASSQTFAVKVDGQVEGTFTPTDSSFRAFVTSTFAVTAGTHTVSLVGLNPNGQDNTALIDQAAIVPMSTSNQFNDGGFETPSAGTGFVYDPIGAYWIFNGSAGFSGNGNAFTAGNTAAPQGTQVAFLQGTGSASQAVNFTAGSYTISLSAVQRGNQPSNQTFAVEVDGQTVSTFTPAGPAYASVITSSFTVTAGVHTVSFVGLNPHGGDNTAFIDQASIQPYTPPTLGNNQVNDGNFQTPSVGAAYVYDPQGALWGFTGSAGLTGNGNAFTAGDPSAPQGTQVAFLQMTGSASQIVNFATGSYTISFSAAQRAGQANSQTVAVQVDSQTVGSFTAPGTYYSPAITNTFTISTAGNHTVRFVGLNPHGGDNTAFIDQVNIQAYTPPAANQFGDAGFEAVNVGTGSSSSYLYNPTGSAWSFAGSAGLAGNGSAFTSANPNAPQGTQVAFLQGTGSISQVVNFTAGNYTLNFSAAQRATSQASTQTFQVQVDSLIVGTITPAGTNYNSYATSSFSVAVGNHTVAFIATNPQGGDNTAFLDQISIQTYTGPTADQFTDPGFEALNLGIGSASYAYDPTGTPWTFTGSSGVAANNSLFTYYNVNAPQGTQVAFLQMTGSFSQLVNFTGGALNYTISFFAAQRADPVQTHSQDFKVLVDSTVVGTFTPTGFSYAQYTTSSFTVLPGLHTVSFVGLDSQGGDNTAFIDELSIATH